MKRNLPTIIFLLVTQLILAQNVKTENRAVNFTDGRAVFNYSSTESNIEFKENLEYYWFSEYSGVKSTKGGSGGKLLHGKYQVFNKKGNLISESNYNLGLKDGTQKEWNEEGDLVGTYKYKNGERYYQKFKSDKGDILIEWTGEPLVDGSVKRIYSLYGNLQQQEIQLDGLKRKITKYYHDGKIKNEFTIDFFDKMHDSYVQNYPYGNVEVQGQFEFNSRTGEWKWFNEDGSLSSTELYRINILKYPDGTEKAKGGEYYDEENKEWIKNGQWYFYNNNGDLESIKEYKYGEEIKKKRE